MKLSKDQIIEAAILFNRAKTIDEFKMLLDLSHIQFDIFETSYYKLVDSIYPPLAKAIGKNKRFDSKTFMEADPKTVLGFSPISTRFKLPLWIEFVDDSIQLTMPGYKKVQIGYSPKLISEFSAIGIDGELQILQMLLSELGR